jgi:hypothetical protein
MTQHTTEHTATALIEGVIAMTPRDNSREDFMRRIERMLLCLSDVYHRAETDQHYVVEPIGYEGSARERTLRFRYRLVPTMLHTPLARAIAA